MNNKDIILDEAADQTHLNTAIVAKQVKQAVKKYTSGKLIVRSKGGKTRFIMVAAGHIDNKLRKMMIDLMSPNANIHNKDDISYGNVTDKVISAETRHWVKALGLTVVNEESTDTIPTFHQFTEERTFKKGDRVVGRRGNFKGEEAKVVNYDWRLGELTVAVAGKKVRATPSDWNKIRESVELDEANHDQRAADKALFNAMKVVDPKARWKMVKTDPSRFGVDVEITSQKMAKYGDWTLMAWSDGKLMHLHYDHPNGEGSVPEREFKRIAKDMMKESVEVNEMQPHGMFGGQKKKSTRPSRPTRIAVDKEFTKVNRSGKMDTMAAKDHLEKKFGITDVRIEKDKNGKPHVTYFQESTRPEDNTNHPKNSQSSSNITDILRAEKERKAAAAMKKTESNIPETTFKELVELDEVINSPGRGRAKEANIKRGRTSDPGGDMVITAGKDSSGKVFYATSIDRTSGDILKVGTNEKEAVKLTKGNAVKIVRGKATFVKAINLNKGIGDTKKVSDAELKKLIGEAVMGAAYPQGHPMRKFETPASPQTKKLIEGGKAKILKQVTSVLGDTTKFVVIENPKFRNAKVSGEDKVLMATISDPKRGRIKMFAFHGSHISIAKAMQFAINNKLVVTTKMESVEHLDEALTLASDNLNLVKKTAEKLAKQSPDLTYYVVKHNERYMKGMKYAYYEVYQSVDMHLVRGKVKKVAGYGAKVDMRESVELDEGTPAYRKAMAAYKNSDTKKVFDILKKKGFRGGSQGDVLVRNMLKKNKGNVQKAAAEIEKKYPNHFKGSVELDEKMDPTKHVKKNDETGMYCVYNKDGKKAKEFKDKSDADKWATDNHDSLMESTFELETMISKLRNFRNKYK